MSKKKIIIASTIPLSIDIFYRGALRELSEQYEVVALSSPDPLMKTIEEREGVRTIAIKMERRMAPFADLRSLVKLAAVLRRERPSMIHSMTPKAGLLCMAAAWMARIPIRIHTFTGLVFPTAQGLTRRLLMTTDRLTCHFATHIIPEGEGVKNDLIKNKITTKPLKVLGYGNLRGVDMQYYSQRPEIVGMANGIRSSLFTFLFVGRIARDKGIDELCAAFDNICRKRENVRLILVGPDERDIDPIAAETERIMGSNQRIEMVGMKCDDELLAYYAAADCFVLPSYREGFPNTVLEAGAMGLPSIVTDINGSREIITNGTNGLIVEPRNTETLEKAMLRMIDENSTRQQMAQHARQMIADRFEQGFVRSNLYSFYKQIMPQ